MLPIPFLPIQRYLVHCDSLTVLGSQRPLPPSHSLPPSLPACPYSIASLRRRRLVPRQLFLASRSTGTASSRSARESGPCRPPASVGGQSFLAFLCSLSSSSSSPSPRSRRASRQCQRTKNERRQARPRTGARAGRRESFRVHFPLKFILIVGRAGASGDGQREALLPNPVSAHYNCENSGRV